MSIFFVDEVPEGVQASSEELVPLESLAARILKKGLAHDYRTQERLLRVAEFTRGDSAYFFLHNESLQEVRTTVTLPMCGKYIAADFLNDVYTRGETAQGETAVELAPGQSVMLLFGGVSDAEWAAFPEKSAEMRTEILDVLWNIDLRETGRELDFRPFRRQTKLFNITGRDGEREFSGEMRYRTCVTLDKAEHMELEFEHVGMTARLSVNGKDMGQRICAPYRWDITEAVQQGENEIEVLAANTLVQRMQDGFSAYMPIPASGLTGAVTLYCK